MSSRSLKRFEQNPAILEPSSESSEDIEDGQDNTITLLSHETGQNKLNPFDLLNRKASSLSESEVKEDDDRETEAQRSASNLDDGNKRKKKKKRRKTKSNNKHSSEDNVDEIERVVQEVDEILGKSVSIESSNHFDNVAMDRNTSLLRVEHKNLNPENEMRRIFGSKVVQSEQNKRRRGKASHLLRSYNLVALKAHWPPMTRGGITMKYDTVNNLMYFEFEHNSTYQEIEKKFLQAVNTLSPESVMSILQLHPYHVDALIQLSEVCKMGEDTQMAMEFIERAVCSLESAFHPMFNLTQGNCRLDYRYQTNRPFYIAIFKHLTYISQRACHRTALEFCKLLLNLDPEDDPIGVTLAMDFYAIKSQQYKWLTRFYKEFEMQRNLSQLPNYAFSIPLAYFYCAQTAEENFHDLEKADEMLQSALLMFPSLLLPMLDKCSIQPDPSVISHTFFGYDAVKSTPEALASLIELYIGRSYHVWKDPELLPWLERNTKEVLSRVDAKDPTVVINENKRKSRYQGTPRNVYRHIILSDIPGVTVKLPPDLARSPVLSYDPLPPSDSINTYTAATRTPNPDANSSILSVFWRSLLPNFNPDEIVELQDEAAGAGAIGEFQRSVTTLIDAMRDLLGNMNLQDLPQDDADVDETE